MITRNNLPKNFLPYKKLVICSNSLIDGGFLLSIGDVLPLIIGKGQKPLIWLQAVVNSKSQEFIQIVEASVSKHPHVSVIEENNNLTINIKNTKILSINKYEDSAIIDYMDLKQIGFNIYGDEQKLIIGNSTFSGNSMSGGGTLIGLDT